MCRDSQMCTKVCILLCNRNVATIHTKSNMIDNSSEAGKDKLAAPSYATLRCIIHLLLKVAKQAVVAD